MALADLLQAIEREADEELAQLERESEAEAERIRERARAEASALEAELASAAEPVARAEAERLPALARVEAAATLRNAREEALAPVLDAVRARLARAREDARYPELLRALLAESHAALPEAVVVRVDARDEALARQVAGSLRVEPVLQSWGGVELVSEDGRAVRNTLERRLENAAPLLRLRFAAAAAQPATERVLA